MIHRTVPILQVKSWQEELQQLISCPKSLIKYLQLDPELTDEAIKASAYFPLKVTESYLSRIQKGNPRDPLLLQILPLGEEFDDSQEYSSDPLQEKQFQPVPGVIHKYQSRVLFIAATQCAIHCRYCFRRHFPYNDNSLNRKQWRAALDYIADSKAVNEVILSGGDPLSLNDKQLSWLSLEIAKIPHITRFRIHTRYPIILPSRITPELLAALSHTRLKTVIVIHCNHPQEIDSAVEASLHSLKSSGFTLLNQSVLLKGINDNAETLSNLSERLFKAGVLPYYLHLLDKVIGAKHFDVSEQGARRIYKDLLARVPGYLAPKLVKETPLEQSKTLLNL